MAYSAQRMRSPGPIAIGEQKCNSIGVRNCIAFVGAYALWSLLGRTGMRMRPGAIYKWRARLYGRMHLRFDEYLID